MASNPSIGEIPDATQLTAAGYEAVGRLVELRLRLEGAARLCDLAILAVKELGWVPDRHLVDLKQRAEKVIASAEAMKGSTGG